MKKTILVVIIVILSIVSCVSIGMVIYYSNNYIKIPKQIKCETAEVTSENFKYQQVVVININKEQYVENFQNKTITTFLIDENYNMLQKLENTDDVSYEYDDTKKRILTNYKEKQIQDENGNPIDIWYKEYIKNMELSGYTCKTIK